ncbi:MAG TPA: hypothetical protein VFY73_29960 [Ideonella sp.]|nr:hypothetical protein [Ideonella sp.]HEX5688266.1 hypothetical protein [Ideonella sp.]
MEAASKKTARGIYISDLANYLDTRRDVAVKEARQLAGTAA